MKVTAEDLENMMADILYNQTLRNQFLEQNTVSNVWVVNEAKMRRQLICDWVNKNTPKILKNWVPTSSTQRRCLGEMNFQMSSTGLYTPSLTCSGHGVCQPDPWLPYAGVCECYRGYEFRDCSVLSTGEVVNVALDGNNSVMPAYFILVVLAFGGGIFLLGNWTLFMKDTPIFYNLAVAHSFILLFAGSIVLLSYPFWVLLPSREVCTMKWSLLALGTSIGIGINGIKMNWVLSQVTNMPQDRPEREREREREIDCCCCCCCCCCLFLL